MKYGEYFENESVPRWSLHNIDYNTLKQLIKVNTTKNQATAIAIPGQLDHGLQKFEAILYRELTLQHDRVDLFVSSKADEIARRLRHLAGLVHSLAIRCADPHALSLRTQKRLAKCHLQILECGRDIRDLERFVCAQKEALRKIVKKYKKWTGSLTLPTRFREEVLANYKSFTQRDFAPLQQQYQDLLTTVQAVSPSHLSPHDPATDPASRHSSRRSSATVATPAPAAPAAPPPAPRYWNEYDHGSEAGDHGDGDDGGYALYIDPDEASPFPGLETLARVLGAPARKIRGWVGKGAGKEGAERQSLLHDASVDYFSIQRSGPNTDAEATEDDDTSSTDYPGYGYATRYAALPSIADQRASRYRERVLHHGTILSFLVAFVLLVVGGVLVATGRRKLQLEVDVGVTLAAVFGLISGFAGLGASMYRQDALSVMYRLAVWTTFLTVCVLSGFLLVIVAASTGA